MLFIFLPLVAKALPADSAETEKKGLVIYRARILEPPFEFTGVEEDTLRLNGIPYYPVRKYEKELRKWKKKRLEEEIELMKKMFPDSVVKRKLAKRERKSEKKPEGTHQLIVSAINRADSADTFEGKVATYARIMAESPMVDSTRILKDKRVMVYWKGVTEPEYGTLSREKKVPLTKEQRRARHIENCKRHMKDFWDSYNRGGTVAFGGLPGYVHSSKTEETLKAIEKLSRGDTLTGLERERSIFRKGPFGKKSLYLFKERFRREGKGE
jgi:hypothetical protein